MELPYLAGLIDGEGSIVIARPTPSNPRKYQLRLAICMTHEPTVRAVAASFGGHVKRVNQAKYNSRARERFDWIVSGPTAADILHATLPWLITKAEAAAIGLSFQSTIGRRGVRVPDSILAVREQYANDLGKVNRRGV